MSAPEEFCLSRYTNVCIIIIIIIINCASKLSIVGLISGLQKIALIFLFSNFLYFWSTQLES